jgi:hypothetical protein
MSTLAGNSTILLLAAIAGAIVMISTMVLIGTRRIYVDKETKEVTEIDFPLLGKMKTQSPALFLVAVGFMLTAYAVYQDATLWSKSMTETTPGTLEGEIELNGAHATVLVLAVPSQYENVRQTSGKFTIPVPLLPSTNYQVSYQVDQHIFAVPVDFSNNVLQAQPFNYTPPQSPDEPPQNLQIQRQGVSDEELKNLGISH